MSNTLLVQGTTVITSTTVLSPPYTELDIPGPYGEGGELNVNQGGILTIAGPADIGDNFFTSQDEAVVGATGPTSSGTLIVEGAVTLGNNSATEGTLEVQQASSLTVFGDFVAIAGSLSILSASQAAIYGTLSLGGSFAGNVSATVDGPTTLLTAGSISMQSGALDVTGGAVVTDSSGLSIGNGASASVTGAGSTLAAESLLLSGLSSGPDFQVDDHGLAAFSNSITLTGGAVLDMAPPAYGPNTDPGGAVVIGSAFSALGESVAEPGAVDIDPFKKLTAVSTSPYAANQILGNIIDDGVIEAEQAAVGALPLQIMGSIDGDGTILIDPGATVEISGAVAPGVTVEFGGAGAALALVDPAAFQGKLEDFGSGDMLEITGTSANGATYDPNAGQVRVNGTSYTFTDSIPFPQTGSFSDSGNFVVLTVFDATTFVATDLVDANSYDWSDLNNWTPGFPVNGAEVTIDTGQGVQVIDDYLGPASDFHDVGLLNIHGGSTLVVPTVLTVGVIDFSSDASDNQSVIQVEDALTIGAFTGSLGVIIADGATVTVNAASDPGETYLATNGGEVILAAVPAAASTLEYEGIGTIALSGLSVPFGQQSYALATTLTGVEAGDVLEVPGSSVVDVGFGFGGLNVVTSDALGENSTYVIPYSFDASPPAVFDPNAFGVTTDPTTGLLAITFEAVDAFSPHVLGNPAATDGAGDDLWSFAGNWTQYKTPFAGDSVVVDAGAGPDFLDNIAGENLLSIQVGGVNGGTLGIQSGITLTVGTLVAQSDITTTSEITPGTIVIQNNLTFPDNDAAAITITAAAVIERGVVLSGGIGDTKIFTDVDNESNIVLPGGDPLEFKGPVTGTGSIAVGTDDEVTFDAAVSGGQTIEFTDATGTVVLNDPADFAASIEGFQQGDSLILTGLSGDIEQSSPDSVSFFLPAASTPFATLNFIGSYGASDLDFNPATGTVSTDLSCFLAGTRIATDRGPVAVEALVVGDLVMTQSGQRQSIRWLGHRDINTTLHPQPEQVYPVRISAHAFGQGRPSRALLLSPDHAVFVDSVLIPVRYLCNDRSVRQVRIAHARYFHIELAQHDVVFAEGLPVETYLETGSRNNFIGGATTLRLHADFGGDPARLADIWDCLGYAPLHLAGATVDAVRRRLNDQARRLAAQRHKRHADGLEAAA